MHCIIKEVKMSKAVINQSLESRWNEKEANGMSEADLLLYRSNILGSDKRVTNYGGGNTSAKIIENIQRDISIAFFNQLTEVFLKLKLNPNEIFKAAATKWNFIKLKPGLVGGHCIPVDPYYFYDFLKKKKINIVTQTMELDENSGIAMGKIEIKTRKKNAEFIFDIFDNLFEIEIKRL